MFNALTCRVAEEYLWSRIFIPLQVVIEKYCKRHSSIGSNDSLECILHTAKQSVEKITHKTFIIRVVK